MKLGTAFIGVLFYGTVLAPLYTVLFLRNFKKGLPDFSESPIKFDTRTSKMLRISSVAGIRQMPAKAIKQGLPSKLEVPVIIAFYALISLLSQDYSIILATRPEPTVLPPSRIRLGEPCVTGGIFSGFSVIIFSENIDFLCSFKIFVANL